MPELARHAPGSTKGRSLPYNPFVIWVARHLLLICVSVALAAAAARAQAARTTSAAAPAIDSKVAEAQRLLQAGQADAAIAVLSALSGNGSTAATINHLLGLAYYQKNDYAHAIEYLSRSLSQTAVDSKQRRQSVQLLGMAHFFLNHYKEAIPYLEQVKTWAPDNVEAAYVLGISHIQTGNPDAARAAFARMFKVPPASAAAHLLNAQMMIRQEFEDFAEKELRAALALDPRLPQAHFLLGELAIYRANIALGIELLQKEIEINPGFGMAYYRLGEAYTRELKWDEAIGPLQKAIWLSPYFSGPYIVLGKVYLKKGDLTNAEGMLRRALKMDPNNYSGHHLLAQVLRAANRPDEAKKEFETAEQLRNQ